MNNAILSAAYACTLCIALSASEPSPLAGRSFLTFHPTSTGDVHRCTLRFDRDGNAFSDMFPVSSIPATGTIKIKRARRGRSSISDFSAQGEAPFGLGSVSFSAALEGGQGAKGTVTIKQQKKDPVVISFHGKG